MTPVFMPLAGEHYLGDLVVAAVADHGPFQIFVLVVPRFSLAEHLLQILAESDLDDLRKRLPADRRGLARHVQLGRIVELRLQAMIGSVRRTLLIEIT